MLQFPHPTDGETRTLICQCNHSVVHMFVSISFTKNTFLHRGPAEVPFRQTAVLMEICFLKSIFGPNFQENTSIWLTENIGPIFITPERKTFFPPMQDPVGSSTAPSKNTLRSFGRYPQFWCQNFETWSIQSSGHLYMILIEDLKFRNLSGPPQPHQRTLSGHKELC